MSHVQCAASVDLIDLLQVHTCLSLFLCGQLTSSGALQHLWFPRFRGSLPASAARGRVCPGMMGAIQDSGKPETAHAGVDRRATLLLGFRGSVKRGWLMAKVH